MSPTEWVGLTHQSPFNAEMREAAFAALFVSVNRPKQLGPLPERRASWQPSDAVSAASTSSMIGHNTLAGGAKSLVRWASA